MADFTNYLDQEFFLLRKTRTIQDFDMLQLLKKTVKTANFPIAKTESEFFGQKLGLQV